MKKITRNLILLNICIWLSATCVYLVTIKSEQSFLRENERLVTEMVSLRNYDEYKKREASLATKMTDSVLSQVCPIVQVSEEASEVIINNMKTTYSNFQKNEIETIISFNMSVNQSASRIVKLRAVYTKNKDQWLMSHYNYI